MFDRWNHFVKNMNPRRWAPDIETRMPGTRFRIWIARHRPELWFGLRLTLAALLAYAFANLFRLPQTYWSVLTAVIVMQPSLGASFKSIVERVVSTILGAAWAVAVSAALHGTHFASVGLLLALVVAPLAFLAAFKPAYRIAPVTAIIVLLGSSAQHEGSLVYALYRSLEVSLGCVIAIGVAVLVPAHAQSFLMNAVGTLLDLMATQVSAVTNDLVEPGGAAGRTVRLAQFREAMTRVESMAAEVAHERLRHLTRASDPEPLVQALRRIRIDLIALGRAVSAPLPEPIRAQLASPSKRMSAAIAAYFRKVAKALTRDLPAPSFVDVDVASVECLAAIDALREGPAYELTAQTARQVSGFAFALQELRTDLRELDKIVNAIADEEAAEAMVAEDEPPEVRL